VGDTTLRLFDAHRYNFTVEQPGRLLGSKVMLNFKGERKRRMPEFAEWWTQARR
jgi:hypothetical protein